MTYEKMAKLYDKLVYDIDYDLMVSFIEDNIKNKGIRSILELGCGTGNITERLNGYNVYAIDNSEEMLTIASSKLFNKRNIKFINMDIRKLELNRKFDLAIAGLDVINYLKNEEDLRNVFKKVYNHLKENSLFIFDINSEYKIKDYIGNNVFTDEVENIVYIWQGNYDFNTEINEYLVTFFVEKENKMYERFSESHFEKAYNMNTVINLLKEAGFSKVESFDSFNKRPVHEKSLRISFLAYRED